MTKSKITQSRYTSRILFCFLAVMVFGLSFVQASSHREAPLISLDPFADNTDLYAFRSPDNPDMITIIASYVPFQLPQGGPNWYGFSDHVRYEIHIDNDAGTAGDEILYYITFSRTNEDPTTFFNIRLGAQNLKTTYTIERSMDGGQTFQTIITDGVVPPPNIGPRSIESQVGLGTTYEQLIADAISTTSTGERVFCGPSDDPFFVDLGGIFDLGNSPRQDGAARDGVGCYNVSTIALQIPISTLLKSGASATPSNILDADYVIGVWAAASRKQIKTFNTDGPDATYDGPWVQVSRLGMPLTNEAVVPIGQKDYWNAISPYDEITDQVLDPFFFNPELALYMDDDQFGGAVPAFSALRIQRNSLGMFDFGNGQDGLFGLKGNPALDGTALDDDIFGTLLLPGPGLPRSVDLWPIFHTGAPNLAPYQLATGKDGNPLAPGKPFINNFLPNGGDMLRLNMAVPPTDRNSADFSSLGLINAAVLGLTDPRFNTNADLELIPNMDGFPNGRRLEDDVTRIELQAVSGAVLAAIGLWYDDYVPGPGVSPVTDDLLGVLTYTTGVEQNDVSFKSSFPYVASPFSAVGDCSGVIVDDVVDPPNPMTDADLELNISAPRMDVSLYETVPFTITITNNGPLNATNVSVRASIPQGLVYSSQSTTAGSYDPFGGIWNVGILAPGASATLNQGLFTVQQGTMVTNFVQVMTSDQNDPDSTPGNDTNMTADEDDESSFTVNVRGSNPNVNAQLFASSNTQGLVGIFNLFQDGTIDMKAKEVLATDADGIFYGPNDDLIQLNRTDNRLDYYKDVNLNLNASNSLEAAATSTSDFSNGREIAVSMDWVAVAQDANDSNGQVNQLLVYTVNGPSFTLAKTHVVDINLWGIHADGNDLYAIIDNSDQLAVFDNFFDAADGPLTPSRTITIEGMIRTHGLTYVADRDMMILTDVGAATSPTDGAFTVVKDFTAAASDGNLSLSEQLRVEGNNTFLGNPVDVAFDEIGDRIFIAERANEGGRVLGYFMPTASGNMLPTYNRPFMGASAIYFSNWADNTGRFEDGANTEKVIDPNQGAQVLNQQKVTLGTLYPVPATTNLFSTLESNFTGVVELLIFNADGKIVSSNSHEIFEGVNTIELDITEYPSGFYYMKILDRNSKNIIDVDSEKFKFLKMN